MSFIKNLRETVEFQKFLKDLEFHRPILPTFDPLKDNTELWKKKSGEIEGFDFIFQLLKGNKNGTE